MISRRKFVKGTTAGILLSMALPEDLLASLPPKRNIGIQLYTLRDQIKDDFVGTLTQISKIGFDAVEAAGYSDRKFYGYSPAEYKMIVEDLGLAPLSSHSMVNISSINEIIDDTLEAGMKYLVVPSLAKSRRDTLDGYKIATEEFNFIGERCKEAGLKFAYHNHDFEFKELDGVIPYDILLRETESDFMTMQLDIYWIKYGGADPLEYFKKYPKRFKLWHVKDMDDTEQQESIELGDGIINYQDIFRKKAEAGMKYYFLEQEKFKIPPYESIDKSFKYLSKLKY